MMEKIKMLPERQKEGMVYQVYGRFFGWWLAETCGRGISFNSK